jgi:hypothetical protein
MDRNSMYLKNPLWGCSIHLSLSDWRYWIKLSLVEEFKI